MPVWATDPETINITENAIESLKSDRLIIIDNGSTIGGGQLRSWADIYIRNKENLGYARAVNQGLKLAGDVVAVANNDIRLPANWKEVALDILRDEKIGSVHFRMIPYDQPFNPGNETWAKGKEKWCSSSFFVMRNFLLYDEGFLNSLDDWDYWRRFREHGFFTAYTNRSEYQHLDSWTQMRVPERNANDARNLAHYIDKYGERPEEWFARTYPDQVNLPWKPMP